MRQEQTQRALELRSRHETWTAIATEFAERYGVNVRVAFRLAHGWSQGNAADEWNKRWPAEPKTFKSFSYWELWPASTGHAPSLDVLARLAELYECRVADLLVDCPDFRHNDAAHQARAELTALPDIMSDSERNEPGNETATHEANPASAAMAPVEKALRETSSEALLRLAAHLDNLGIDRMSQTAGLWTASLDPGHRRGLLLRLSAALSLAAADAAFPNETVTRRGLPHRHADAPSLTGLWLSRYSYYSTTRNKEFQGEHYVVLRPDGEDLSGSSLAHSTGSRLALNLSVNAAIATGTWTEHTSLSGHYAGAVYHGTLQLVVSPNGRSMRGKWIGFGKDFDVNTGDWQLTWKAEASDRAVRDHANKL
ncbi:MAG TPA: hypothetical protein VHX59_25845 [Mycobacteriales bacterium]|nr:hypothetical protein [Mycobacteriales bacterium]